MNKYIDAELLRKEVKMLEKAAHKSALGCADSETRKFHEGKDYAYQHVGVLIDSLQQEQPDVDLEKEINSEWAKCNPIDEGMGSEYVNISIEQFDALSRHFFELGQQEMRRRIMNPKYNAKAVEQLKSEHPTAKALWPKKEEKQ